MMTNEWRETETTKKKKDSRNERAREGPTERTAAKKITKDTFCVIVNEEKREGWPVCSIIKLDTTRTIRIENEQKKCSHIEVHRNK
jgi:hypothetical protein